MNGGDRIVPLSLRLTHKAIPGAVNGSNFGKTSIGSYKGLINEKKIIFLTLLKIFSFCVVLRLRGIIVAPPIYMVQIKNFFPKNLLVSALLTVK